MGSASDFYENKILDSILGDHHSSRFPATVYVTLFSVAPTDSTFGTELVGGSFGRASVANDSTHWPDAVSGVKANGLTITFPTLTGTISSAVAWGILDDVAGADAANIILWGALSTTQSMPSGMTPTFPAATLVVNCD